MSGEFQGTYSCEQVIITVGGVIVTGFGESDAVTVKYDNDRYTAKAGCDGEVARAKTADRMGTFEIVLAHTSAANAELTDLFKLNLMGGTDNVVPVTVADLSGTGLATASSCWLKSSPDFVRGREVGEGTWTIQAADLAISY